MKKYLTTMNLPAPKSSEFHEKMMLYEGIMPKAIDDLQERLTNFFDVQRVFTFNSCFTGLALLLNFACQGHGKKSRWRRVPIEEVLIL